MYINIYACVYIHMCIYQKHASVLIRLLLQVELMIKTKIGYFIIKLIYNSSNPPTRNLGSEIFLYSANIIVAGGC
jgi:hypothetical protein